MGIASLILYFMSKVKAKPPTPTTCTEGETKCENSNYYECHNNQWQLIETNSSKCGGGTPGKYSYKITTESKDYDLNKFGLPLKKTVKNIKVITITDPDGTPYKAVYNSLPMYGRFNNFVLSGQSVKLKVLKTFPKGLYVILTTYSNTNSVIKTYTTEIDTNGLFCFPNAIDISNVAYIKLAIGEKVGNTIIKSPLVIPPSEMKTFDVTAYKIEKPNDNNLESIIKSGQFGSAMSIYTGTTPYTLNIGLQSTSFTIIIFDSVAEIPQWNTLNIANLSSSTSIKIEAGINKGQSNASLKRYTLYNTEKGKSLVDIAEEYIKKYNKFEDKAILKRAYNLLASQILDINISPFYGYIYWCNIGQYTPSKIVSFAHHNKAIKSTGDAIIYSAYGPAKDTNASLIEKTYEILKVTNGMIAIIPSIFNGQSSANQIVMNVSAGYKRSVLEELGWYYKLVLNNTYHKTHGYSDEVQVFSGTSLKVNITYTQNTPWGTNFLARNGVVEISDNYLDGIYPRWAFEISGAPPSINWGTIASAGEKYPIQSGIIIPLINKPKSSYCKSCHHLDFKKMIGEDVTIKDFTNQIWDVNAKDWYHTYLDVITTYT